MSDIFEWFLRCRTTAELAATFRVWYREPGLFHTEELGPPFSALYGPCIRCWWHPRLASSQGTLEHCVACETIRKDAGRLRRASGHLVTVWGRMTPSPRLDPPPPTGPFKPIHGVYFHGEDQFLVLMQRRHLRPWLQEIALYLGGTAVGVLQCFPPLSSPRAGLDLADLLGRAVFYAEQAPTDRLVVHFYAMPHLVLHRWQMEEAGLLSMDLGSFLGFLEMASVFRSLLYPDAQEALEQLLRLKNPQELQFYWGRFMGMLSPEAREMLAAWDIRNWPRLRVKTLYALRDYVAYRSLA